MKHQILFLLLALFVYGCEKEADIERVSPAMSSDFVSVKYEWGDQSLSRQNYDDIIKFNTNKQLDRIITLRNKVDTLFDISLSYQGNKIALNTQFLDVYQLDNQGRVIVHTATHNDNLLYVNKEEYLYDGNGYLSKVTLSGNEVPFSVIKYKVENGNYVSYSVSDPNGSNLTRHYDFTYNSTLVKSSFAFHSPILSNNTYSSIEKYLNFGKGSANQLINVMYRVTNLDNKVRMGQLSVISEVVDGYIIKQELIGPKITGHPADNLSPLPRSISFEYAVENKLP